MLRIRLRTILRKYSYPPKFIESCIYSFLNIFSAPNAFFLNAPKRNASAKMPRLIITSFQIRKTIYF